MRENHKTEEYFHVYLNKRSNRIHELLIKEYRCTQEGTDFHPILYYRLFRHRLEKLLAEFSLGTNPLQLKEYFIEVLEVTEKMDDMEYDDLLKLLCFGVLLDYSPCDIFSHILEIQIDSFLCMFTDYLQYKVQTEVEPDLYHPHLWLFDLSSKGNHPGDIEKILWDYLESYWYEAQEKWYWYGTLQNSHDVYFGYWCFEAMALAKIYGVDTTRLVQSDYFALL